MSKRYALISVFDKREVVPLARLLKELDYEIISTGGTAKELERNGVDIIPIEQITGNPEAFDGRMKTISFQVESGILFDRSKTSHQKEARKFKIKPIDIVVCNLYPFEKTIQTPGTTFEQAIEMIDVGGPTMIRAAAKNHKHVLVLCDPGDYETVGKELKHHKVTGSLRRRLAAKAFRHLSYYDSQIGSYLETDNYFPTELTIPGKKVEDLRYGENPHQQAAVYLQPNIYSLFSSLQKKAGRGLSLTNITDINAGIEAVRLFREPAAVVIKHNTPCGIALGKNIKEALNRAIEADPESAFGGVIVLNKPLDKQTAQIIATFKDERRSNIDIVAVPDISDSTVELLTGIRKTMGIYAFGRIPPENFIQVKWINGGFAIQTNDIGIKKSFKKWEVVTKKKPTPKQLEQMKIGWQFISRIRSNAIIIIDKNFPMTRGIGTGQTSRVRSTRIALEQAGEKAKGAVLVSDSFFPFDDSVRMATKQGIGAIVQQGGSVNDKLSIQAADEAGIPMVLTHRRAFWH